MNDVNLISQVEIDEMNNLQVAKSASKKETPVISLPVEKKLLAPPAKDFPVDKWMMPPEQHGYIHGNDNDCL